MALPIRPGVYKQEFDNSITMTVGGLGGIGVCGRFEKGEIGVAVDVPDRETLERQFGKSIAGYNQEDWMYVDNIFYYTGNIVISRVEETEWKYKRGFFTVPCENAQTLIYNRDKIAFNCGNSFNLTALSKGTNVAEDWSNWERSYNIVGNEPTPDVFDYSFLVKNHNDDIEEIYKNGIAKKYRNVYKATVDLWDDMSDLPETSDQTDINKYNLTENISSLKDGSLIVCSKAEGTPLVAKMIGKQKTGGLALGSDSENYWTADKNDEVRVFAINLRKLNAADSDSDYRQLYETESAQSGGIEESDVRVYDEASGFKEIGYYVEDQLYLNNFSYTFKSNDIIVPLKTSDINATGSKGADEVSKIEELLIDNSCESLYTTENAGVTYYEVSFEGEGANIDSKLHFNFIYHMNKYFLIH